MSKNRLDIPLRSQFKGRTTCYWCGTRYYTKLFTRFCCERCRYAYKNERVARQAKQRGITMRQLWAHNALEADLTSQSDKGRGGAIPLIQSV